MKAVIDTNILIDYLTGYDGAAAELDRYGDPVISRISWVEVLVGAVPGAEEREIREFLRRFTVHELDGQVAEEALQVRRTHKLRLPDAIILATAHVLWAVSW